MSAVTSGRPEVVLRHLAGVPGIVLVILTLLAYVALALAPFKWVPPRRLVNAAVAGSEGLRFPGRGLAYSPEAPAWLTRAAQLGQLRLLLRFRPYSSEQPGPARIFTISRDVHLRNLAVDQDGSDLVIALRRPGSTVNGVPPYRLPGVLDDGGWHDVEVTVSPGRLRIVLDGTPALTEALPEHPLADWDPRYLVALGNELNGIRPWRGEIARALVEAPGARIDYARPGVLAVPDRIWVFANRVTWGFEDYVHPVTTKDWIANFVSFVPLGFLLTALGGPRRSWRKVILACALASLLVEAGQVVFSRHPSAIDLVLNTLGGAVGAGVACWLTAQVHDRTRPPSWVRVGARR